MLTLTRSGPTTAAIAAELRLVVAGKVPLITAKALTFTVQKAQKGIIEAMPRTFQGGATRYTLGATRIETATVAKLQARVAVKDQAPAGGGTLPQDYLLPQVEGGTRKEKRFERALRYAGLLRAGERAVLGDQAPRDAQGNFRIGDLRTLLNSLAGVKRGTPRASARRGGTTRTRGDLFVGSAGGGNGAVGVYRRTGTARAGNKALRPLLIFTTRQPRYAPRLDFEGLARAAAEREFPATFLRLLRAETRAR